MIKRYLIGSAVAHVFALWACANLGGFSAAWSVLPVPAIDVYILDGSDAGGDGDPLSRPAAGEGMRAARPDVPSAPGEPRVVTPPELAPAGPAVAAPASPPISPPSVEVGAPSSMPAGSLGGVDPPAGNRAGLDRGDVHAALKGVGADGSIRAGSAGGGPPPSSFAKERDGATGLLRERIQSRLVYPSEAVRRGLEGEVVLRIRIETGGIPREILVARSSGARLLDVAARRGVVDASPLPTDPGWIEVPVLFRLR